MNESKSTGSQEDVPLVEFWKGIGLWGYGAVIFFIGLHLYVFLFLPLGRYVDKPILSDQLQKRAFQLVYVLGGETEVIDERALLWDSSPLYLPTKHNYAQTIIRFEKHFYGNELLMIYASNLGFLEQFKKQMPLAIYYKPLEVNEILSGAGGDVFKSMGQEPLAVDPLEPRLARVCVRDFSTQELIYCQDITKLKGIESEPNIWEYALFTMDISSKGKSVPALMLRGTGQEVLDQEFQQYIQEDLPLHQLPDGYYEIDFTP